MAKFDKIAHSFDNFLLQFFYNIAHNQNIKFLREYIKDNSQILDIGCGTGNFLNKLKKINKNIGLFGIDESEKMIKIAQNKFKEINFTTANAKDLPFKDNSFNLTTIIDAFYYFNDKKRVFSECYRILKPNGYLFIHTPSIDQFLLRLVVQMTKLFYLERDSEHLHFKELKLLAENSGFKFIKKDLRNWPFLPIIKYWSIIFKKNRIIFDNESV